MTDLGRKCVSLGRKPTNLGLFQIRFHYILARWSDLPQMVPIRGFFRSDFSTFWFTFGPNPTSMSDSFLNCQCVPRMSICAYVISMCATSVYLCIRHIDFFILNAGCEVLEVSQISENSSTYFISPSTLIVLSLTSHLFLTGSVIDGSHPSLRFV